jgi:multicomponent Na+:H+ antiporter subunit F
LANTIYNVAAIISLIAMFIAFIRMMIGPTAADRVVALDVMTVISISFIVFLAVLLKRIIYIDVAIVYGLISFIGVIAIARYLERGI